MAGNAFCIVALAGLALAGATHAQAPTGVPASPAVTAPAPVSTASATASGATLGDLDRIQSQILLAQARLQLAQAQQSLAKTQGTAPLDDGASALHPVVEGVFGQTSAPYAKFLLGDGGETIGRAGDLLPGDFRVVHVGIDKVSIRDKQGHLIVARFASASVGAQGDGSRATPDAAPMFSNPGAHAQGGSAAQGYPQITPARFAPGQSPYPNAPVGG